MTETRHYRRLVTFLEEIESFAAWAGDEELYEIAVQCRSDLVMFCHQETA